MRQFDIGFQVTGNSISNLIQHFVMHDSFLCLQILVSTATLEGHLPLWHQVHVRELQGSSRGLMVEEGDALWLIEVWNLSHEC